MIGVTAMHRGLPLSVTRGVSLALGGPALPWQQAGHQIEGEDVLTVGADAAPHLLGSHISERARRSSSCQQLHLGLRAFFEVANTHSTPAPWLASNTGGLTTSGVVQGPRCKPASSLPPLAHGEPRGTKPLLP